MSRNGSGVYSLPAGSTVSNGDVSDSSDLNTPLADLEADANVARPIVAGGTGASSASGALVNLGLTATAAELNVLDGVTASTAELNILDGVTATTAELNFVDGVTSAIQTQLDGKQVSEATLTSLSGLTLAAGDILYATAADTLANLAKGTDGQVLTLASGVPAWGDPAIGVGQSWENVTGSRSPATSYQNTTGRPIQVCLHWQSAGASSAQVSDDNSTWVTVEMNNGSGAPVTASFVVPAGHYYRTSNSQPIFNWSELR